MSSRTCTRHHRLGFDVEGFYAERRQRASSRTYHAYVLAGAAPARQP